MRVVFQWDHSLEFSTVRGCFEIQPPIVKSPRKPMPCFLPVRSFVSKSLRVFGSLSRLLSFRKTTRPFLLFSPTFGVSHPQAPQRVHVLVRAKPQLSAPRVSLRSPSAFVRSSHPSFHSLAEASKESWPSLSKSPLQGLATLLRMSAPRSLEASFSSQHSWASPFKAFFHR